MAPASRAPKHRPQKRGFAAEMARRMHSILSDRPVQRGWAKGEKGVRHEEPRPMDALQVSQEGP